MAPGEVPVMPEHKQVPAFPRATGSRPLASQRFSRGSASRRKRSFTRYREGTWSL